MPIKSNVGAWLVFTITLLGLCSITSVAQTPTTAGSRLFYTQKGFLPRQGTISIAYTGGVFRNSTGYSTNGGITTGALAQTTGDILFDYSINKNYMIAIGTNVFFTTPNRILVPPSFEPMTTNYTQRVSIALRMGSFGVFSEQIQLGGLFRVMVPVSGEFNSPFQPVGLTAPSVSGDFITSYYFDKVFPRLSPGIHLNLGLNLILMENTNMTPIGTLNNGNNALTMRYAFGLDYPISNSFTLFTEVYGELLLNGQMPTVLYGRDPFSYAVLGTKIQIWTDLWFEAAGEFLVTDNKSSTIFDPARGITPFSTNNVNYPNYRALFGLRYEFSRRKYIPRTADVIYGQASIIKESPFVTTSAAKAQALGLSPIQVREAEIKELVAEKSQVDSLTKLYQMEEAALNNAKREYDRISSSSSAPQEAEKLKALKEKIEKNEKALAESKKELAELRRKEGRIRLELRRAYVELEKGNKPRKRPVSSADKQRGRIILDVIDEQSEEIALFFKELRKYDEKLYGRLYYEITIGKSGRVERVRLLVSSLDESLPISRYTEEQISEKVRNWKFPPGESEVVIDILKLELTPGGNLRISS
ncbi:MAG: hypothetical protein ACK4XY_05685 [Chloroherpetonaceae bacterium]